MCSAWDAVISQKLSFTVESLYSQLVLLRRHQAAQMSDSRSGGASTNHFWNLRIHTVAGGRQRQDWRVCLHRCSVLVKIAGVWWDAQDTHTHTCACKYFNLWKHLQGNNLMQALCQHFPYFMFHDFTCTRQILILDLFCGVRRWVCVCLSYSVAVIQSCRAENCLYFGFYERTYWLLYLMWTGSGRCD